MMMSRSKILAVIAATTLMLAPALGNLAHAEKDLILRGRDEGGRLTLTNGMITVVATAEGKHPQFFWYLNSQEKAIFHVKYRGLIEYLDTGQDIFQRKFKADLENFLIPKESGIKALELSDAGKEITLAGEMKENKEKTTQGIFNYVIEEKGSRIGINITNEIIAKGSIKGKVVVRGTKAGDTRFRVSMTSDELGRPVEESEATAIY